jgi:polygalacturonase
MKKILLLFFSFYLLISCSPGLERISKISPPEFPANRFSITDYGAVGDSVTDSKPAIDSAIKACSLSGGGYIIVPPGVYKVNGPIHLSDNMNLHLSKNAVLRFGSDYKDYLPVVLTSWEGTLLYNYSPFIYAYKKKNIAITGKGTIDGEARNTWAKWRAKQSNDQLLSREMNHKGTSIKKRVFGEGHYLRPQLIQFFKCENILIDSVKIEDSPFWCIHLLFSKNIIVQNLVFDAENFNNDGIDPESSSDVLIENISFNNNDDNIAIKAGRDLDGRKINTPSKNILIRNCHFKGLHGFAIGSEMSAGVKNVYVENCDYVGWLKRGIYLKSNKDRGGYISDIYINNVAFGNVEDCFYITSNYKNEGKDYPSIIKNINLQNITCKLATHYGIIIEGSKEKEVEDIRMENIRIDKAIHTVIIENAKNIKCKNVMINGKSIDMRALVSTNE